MGTVFLIRHARVFCSYNYRANVGDDTCNARGDSVAQARGVVFYSAWVPHAIHNPMVALHILVSTNRCEAACSRMLAVGANVDEHLVSLIRGNAPTNVAVLAGKW